MRRFAKASLDQVSSTHLHEIFRNIFRLVLVLPYDDVDMIRHNGTGPTGVTLTFDDSGKCGCYNLLLT